MKNKSKVFIIILICLLMLVGVRYYLWNKHDRITKIEVYENEKEYLIIKYFNDKKVGFAFEGKFFLNTTSSSADFINENTAVFDGKYLSVPSSMYYEFVFYEDYIEFYDCGEFKSKYDLIITISKLS